LYPPTAIKKTDLPFSKEIFYKISKNPDNTENITLQNLT